MAWLHPPVCDKCSCSSFRWASSCYFTIRLVDLGLVGFGFPGFRLDKLEISPLYQNSSGFSCQGKTWPLHKSLTPKHSLVPLKVTHPEFLHSVPGFLESHKAGPGPTAALLQIRSVCSESHKTVSKTSLAGEVQPPPAWAYSSSGKSPSPLFHTNRAGSTAAALEGERSSPEICKVTTSLSINSPLNIVQSVFSSCQTQLLSSKFCDLLSSFALWIVWCPASSPKAMTGELMDSGTRLHITNNLNVQTNVLFQVRILWVFPPSWASEFPRKRSSCSLYMSLTDIWKRFLWCPLLFVSSVLGHSLVFQKYVKRILVFTRLGLFPKNLPFIIKLYDLPL